MGDYKQKVTAMPHIEVIPRETLTEKQCFQLEELLCETALKYLHYIGIETPCVAHGVNTGIDPYAPLEFRDNCGKSAIRLSELMADKAGGEKEESRKMQSHWICSSNAVSCRDPRECKQCSLGESCRGCKNQFTEICSSCWNRKELKDMVVDMRAELDRYREIESIKECREFKDIVKGRCSRDG